VFVLHDDITGRNELPLIDSRVAHRRAISEQHRVLEDKHAWAFWGLLGSPREVEAMVAGIERAEVVEYIETVIAENRAGKRACLLAELRNAMAIAVIQMDAE
jgi:hypothetical protein